MRHSSNKRRWNTQNNTTNAFNTLTIGIYNSRACAYAHLRLKNELETATDLESNAAKPRFKMRHEKPQNVVVHETHKAGTQKHHQYVEAFFLETKSPLTDGGSISTSGSA